MTLRRPSRVRESSPAASHRTIHREIVCFGNRNRRAIVAWLGNVSPASSRSTTLELPEAVDLPEQDPGGQQGKEAAQDEPHQAQRCAVGNSCDSTLHVESPFLAVG